MLVKTFRKVSSSGKFKNLSRDLLFVFIPGKFGNILHISGKLSSIVI